MNTRVLAAVLALSLASAPLPAQTGLLVVAHGASREWNDGVRSVVGQVHWHEGPVAVAFLMGDEAASAGWDSAVASLVRGGARAAVVVPLMISSHGEHYWQTEFYAGVRAALPAALAGHDHRHHGGPPPIPMRVTAALDTAPELAEALAARWSALPERDRGRALVLVGHGPQEEREARLWMEGFEHVGRAFTAAGLRAPYRPVLLRDDAEAPVRAAAVQAMRDTIVALAQRTGDSVVVLPAMVSSGTITRSRIPEDLAGLPVRYVPAVLAPHPAMARWVERMARVASAGFAPAGGGRGLPHPPAQLHRRRAPASAAGGAWRDDAAGGPVAPARTSLGRPPGPRERSSGGR